MIVVARSCRKQACKKWLWKWIVGEIVKIRLDRSGLLNEQSAKRNDDRSRELKARLVGNTRELNGKGRRGMTTIVGERAWSPVRCMRIIQALDKRIRKEGDGVRG